MVKRKPKSEADGAGTRQPKYKPEAPPLPHREAGQEEPKEENKRIDEASEESFPASDPPAHRGHHI